MGHIFHLFLGHFFLCIFTYSYVYKEGYLALHKFKAIQVWLYLLEAGVDFNSHHCIFTFSKFLICP